MFNRDHDVLITTRRAGLNDIEVLTRLFDGYRQFQGKSYGTHDDLHAARAFLVARLKASESVIFLAENDQGHTLGMAQLFPSFSSVALAPVYILNDLFVALEGRRQGVASALLAAVEKFSLEQGTVRVTLNVARSNIEGQALYQACGWTQDEQFFMFHRFL